MNCSGGGRALKRPTPTVCSLVILVCSWLLGATDRRRQMLAADWQKLWLGGFCAPGIYGSPIRAAGANKRPALAELLTLSSQAANREDRHNGDAGQVLRSWSTLMGGRPVWVARSVDE